VSLPPPRNRPWASSGTGQWRRVGGRFCDHGVDAKKWLKGWERVRVWLS